MLFNSYIFIFAFLPIIFLMYFLLAQYKGGESAITLLVIASLFFYGWWNPIYLLLIIFSIGINYFLGESIVHNIKASKKQQTKFLLTSGILFNIGLLGYFKYTNFIIFNANAIFGLDIHINQIILPLAISFFTFQQIAYLIDTYKGITQEFKFTHYALFVTFFPQLIAGPIVHHKEMLPQFMKIDNLKPQLENVIIGLSIFAIGLFKKVVLADGIAQYSTQIFTAASTGETMSFFIAWGGALTYTFQLYFDFSAYSDMAIGISRIFGILLPLNFYSPYKSLNIIEFWRRWHMTLSRFLRDYVYFSLGGNRKGNFRRYINLLITMLLGGLWHGAGGTFLLWGGMHGSYLLINHWWRSVFKKGVQSNIGRSIAWVITMLSVVVAWVPFRAESMEGTMAFFRAMFGGNGLLRSHISEGGIALAEVIGSSSISFGAMFNEGIVSGKGAAWILVLLLFVVWLPNTQQIMRRYKPALQIYKNEIKRMDYLWLEWRPLGLWAIFYSLVFMFAMFNLSSASEFLYFQF